MSSLLPFELLAVTEIPPNEGSKTEIYLNRSGINTIEVPPDNVHVECGRMLRVRFVNRGAPVHITASSSNAGMFSDFFHENMYVIDEVTLGIQTRKDCSPGFFDIDILAGYGASKATLRVEVNVRPTRGEEEQKKESPVQPVAHGRPHLLMIAMGIALVVYSTWYYTKIEDLNILAFIVLIVGALFVWYRQT
jgi:hypothetical protein